MNFADTLPADPTPAREAAILRAIIDRAEVQWWPVRLRAAQHWATAWVSTDAVRVDDLRVNVRHDTAQRAADALDCRLLTARLADAAWLQASVRVEPQTQAPCTSSTVAMVRHSAAVDAAVAGRAGLVADPGKDWVLTSKLVPDKAANFGWHSTKAPYHSDATPALHLWQSTGLAHSIGHVDYSQVLRLVWPEAVVDGVWMAWDDLLLSPLRALATHEAPAFVRHPNVPRADPRRSLPAPELGWSDLCPYIEAKNHGGPRERTDLVVLHSTENAESPGVARNVAAWFAGPGAPAASAHYIVDAQECWQCVPVASTAYHAGTTANHRGLGVELVGRAAQTQADWADGYSESELGIAASLVAELCARYSIPVEAVDAAGLRAGARGVTTHAAVTEAWHETTHTDPGRGFPMEKFLAQVRAVGQVPP